MNIAINARDIAPTSIVPDPENVRVVEGKPEAMADLIASVKVQGILQPIAVRPLPPEFPFEGEPPRPEFMVIIGHRRHAAALAAGLATMPCVIREGLSEAEIRLMQLAENIRRQEMSAIDIWSAVEAGAKAGFNNTTLAAALNRSERDIARYRAMGSLIPTFKDYIRETGYVPDDRYMRVICQATHDRQKEAAHSAQSRKGHPSTYWAHAFSMLTVKRVPLSLARFDLDKYTGPRTGDLFDEDQSQQYALDVPAFMDLQKEWVSKQTGEMVKAGFGDVAELKVKQYSSEWERPDGVEPHTRPEPMPKRLPKKADRPLLIYAVGMRDDGRIEEFLYEKKRPKEKKPKDKTKEAADPLEGVGSDTSGIHLTNNGVVLLEKAKRDSLAKAFEDFSPLARNDDELMLIVGYLLSEKVDNWHDKAPGISEFLKADGSLDIDGKVDELRNWLRRLIAFTIQKKDHSGYQHVQRIGAWLNAPVSYPTTDDALKALKGPALRVIGRALKWDDKAYSTQAATRKAIAAKLSELTPEHLPMIGWQLPAKPVVRLASRANTGMRGAWSKEQDENPNFCAAIESVAECPCGWPEGDCDKGATTQPEDLYGLTVKQLRHLLTCDENKIASPHLEIQAELDERDPEEIAEADAEAAEEAASEDAKVAAALAAPESEAGDEGESGDTVEEDTAAWEQEREEQGSDVE